jgi:hypothetical protein
MCHQIDCGCGHHTYQVPWGRWRHWDCCCTTGYGRRFTAREEIIGELEEYLKELKAEIKGVEEHIAELKKAA